MGRQSQVDEIRIAYKSNNLASVPTIPQLLRSSTHKTHWLNGTTSDDVSTRQEAPSDRLAGLRISVAQAARQSAQGAGIRSEIEGLLDRMSPEQLTFARASLIQIVDAVQVSSLI